MDRLAKIRDLVEQALDELSRPTGLTHEQYSIVATLHEISLELAALRLQRMRLVVQLQEKEP
jgi:hypothetical protein